MMHGFVRLLQRDRATRAELLLAGPSVHAVADDPEAAQTMDEVVTEWRKLPHWERSRIHLASLPMADIGENAIIVNALQRHATVVVQKSLQEGFGLTVAEAMWKGRPVVASAVGGIRDQIIDGVNGLLLQDPENLVAFAEALHRMLGDRAFAQECGQRAREHVQAHFLAIRQLSDFARLLNRRLISSQPVSEAPLEMSGA